MFCDGGNRMQQFPSFSRPKTRSVLGKMDRLLSHLSLLLDPSPMTMYFCYSCFVALSIFGRPIIKRRGKHQSLLFSFLSARLSNMHRSKNSEGHNGFDSVKILEKEHFPSLDLFPPKKSPAIAKPLREREKESF